MKRRYFTLLEVVLAMMVIVIGMGAIWGFFSVYTEKKRKTFLEIKVERDLREVIGLFETRLIMGDSFFDDGEEGKNVEISKEDLYIDGMKVTRRMKLGIKKSEDQKEALLELIVIYKHPFLPHGKREESYKRYVSFHAE